MLKRAIILTLIMASTPLVKAEEVKPLGPYTATKISKEFSKNAIEAEHKYSDKPIAVIGIVYSIGKDLLDDPIVQLRGNGKFDFLELEVSKDDEYLLKISKNDMIEAICYSPSKVIGSIVMDKCKITKYDHPK